MSALAGKRVLLGITGGIAAYKGAELARALRQAGAEVQVVMTRAATAFITPLTLQALSGRPVRTALLDPAEESGMDHIALARWADLVLVAPATADVLARLAHGLADDLLTTLCLASAAPILAAPAMNHRMWEAPATRANLDRLLAHGVRLIEPGTGEQACGEWGAGRMAEPQEIVAHLAQVLTPGPLAGLRFLVTAGPTREPLDPVRYLSNRSSGRMGYAVAAAAAEAGGQVTLVSGPVALAAPPGVQRVDVETAAEMRREVLARSGECDVLVAVAAVADYRPAAPAPRKIKRETAPLTLALEPTPDILAEVGRLPRRPFTVGFAAETDELEANALGKLRSKGLDLVAANWVGAQGVGFEAEENALMVYWEGGSRELPRAPKATLGRALIGVVTERLRAHGRA
jgi:phosphopantothenoylcysteine decarboxylase/phosphopantothenate--cysteine ligase